MVVDRGARIVDRHVVDRYRRLERRVAAGEYVVDDPLILYEPAAPQRGPQYWDTAGKRCRDVAEPRWSCARIPCGRFGANRPVQGWPAQALFAGFAAGTRLPDERQNSGTC